MKKNDAWKWVWRLFLGGLFFLGFAGAGLAPAGAQEKQARRILIFDPIDLSSGEDGGQGEMGDLFGDSIAIELESQGFEPVAEAEAEALAAGESVLEKGTVLSLAGEAEADLVINGVFRVEGGAIFFGIRAYDVETEQLAVAISEKAEAGLAVYDSIDAIAAQMSEAVRREYQPLKSVVVQTEREETVVEKRVEERLVELGGETREISLVSGDEGASVDPGRHYPAGHILNGRYTFRCKEGTELTVTLRKADFAPRRVTVTVEEGKTEYPLPRLRPLPAEGKMGLHGTLQKPLGLTFSYTLPVLPGTLEAPLRLGLFALPYRYSSGVVPEGLQAVNPVLEAGVRWHFWTSASDRWALAAGGGVSMDNYLFPAAFGTEARPWLGSAALYLELQQDLRAGRRLIFYLQEQYKTPGLIGTAPVTGNGFGQFLVTAGVQWTL